MKKFYQTPEFRSLEQEWEQRLAAEGLGNIEKICIEKIERVHARSKGRDAEYLRVKKAWLDQDSTNVYRQMDVVRREAKEIYFRQLSGCLHQARFDKDLDEVVMTMRSEGARIAEICKALLEEGILKYRGTIRLIIRKYEHRWGIRNWKPEQMDYNLKNKKPIRSSRIWGPNFQIFIET